MIDSRITDHEHVRCGVQLPCRKIKWRKKKKKKEREREREREKEERAKYKSNVIDRAGRAAVDCRFEGTLIVPRYPSCLGVGQENASVRSDQDVRTAGNIREREQAK